jgi:hypothetical protein
VRVNGVLSEELSLKSGVKQGCVLSPLLFNIFMDWIVREVMRRVGAVGVEVRYSKQRKWLDLKERELTETSLTNMLMYADDMVVMGSDFGSVETWLVALDELLCGAGMMMNVKKTKMMVLGGKIDRPIVIRGEKIEEEECFPYLGVPIRAEQSSSCEEVASRIGKAARVFGALYHPLWKRKQVSVETKMKIYRAAVLPVLLYGSEVWVLSVRESERLEVFQMKCLRIILGITKWDFKRNEAVRAETEQCEVMELVTRGRLRWLGHVMRMGEGRLPPQLLYGKIAGKGKRGRPALRWKDMVQADLKKRGVEGWYDIAQDRTNWRKVVHGEKVDAGVRRRLRGRQKKDGEEGKTKEAVGKMKEAVSGGECPKCGKVYRTNNGGWFSKHVSGCGSSRSQH